MACAPPRQIDPIVTAARVGGPLALVALLAVLGALSVAGGLPGGASVAAGPADAVAAASRLDPLLSRSASRLLGLQPSNPWSRSDDPDDGLAPPPAIAPAAPAFPAQTGAAPLHRPVEPAPRRRPLHGSPQSPRAPPLTV